VAGLIHGAEDHQRGFRRIVVLLITLVIVPTALLFAIGILMLIFWQEGVNLLFGVLVVVLVAALVTGVVLALVFLRHEWKLSKLQTDFVSKVSHELRTPLTSIRMFTEMLENEKDPERVSLYLSVLQKETSRLSDRIERLLDWGRMEAGRRIYERRPERVVDIVRGAIDAFDTAYLGQENRIGVEVPDDLPDVLADRAAMVDALLNLLSNAWKYSSGEKHVVIHASADPQHVRIAVKDNGQGIPRNEQRRIWQKFYRVDDRLSRAVEGSGLGLSIVRHVVLAHGGKIELHSEVDRGSTFTIVLPRPPEEALERARAEALVAG
jgi:two-component system phosphate regulon sensor histidine kinase PhoR